MRISVVPGKKQINEPVKNRNARRLVEEYKMKK